MYSILLVIPSLKQGGAERVLSLLANHWSRKGYMIHVVIFDGNNQSYILDDNVILHILHFNNNGFFSKFYNIVRCNMKLRSIILRVKPQSVLSFMIKSNLSVIIATLFTVFKPIISDRSNPFKRLPFPLHLSRILLYRFAGGIIAQTHVAKQSLKSLTGNNNIRVIPNPVRPINIFSSIEKEKIILNIGRLVPEKGHKYLLEAFSLLTSNGWKLVILGEGPLRENLKIRIKDLNLETKVFMPGSVKDVDLWLARSSIFAFSSISEGFPNALLEAMSAGLPCISFDCKVGPSEIIQHLENGFLVPVGDVNEFSNTMDRLIVDDFLRQYIGKNSIARSKMYSLNNISCQYLDFVKNHHD